MEVQRECSRPQQLCKIVICVVRIVIDLVHSYILVWREYGTEMNALLLQKDSLGVLTCENNHVVDIDDVNVPNLFYVINACIGSWSQRFDCI